MENNTLVSKGQEIARYYYATKRYFQQFILLTEGVANLLKDRGWEITLTTSITRQPLEVNYWDWKYDRSMLPKNYWARFKKMEGSNDLDDYGFSIWFFNNDPDGEQPWVPTAFFSRITLEKEGNFNCWTVDPKIAEVVRPRLLANLKESCFIEFKAPWPTQLAGEGVDNQIQSISVVPFPLAAINTSDDIEKITTKAIEALSLKNPAILTEDKDYLKLAWGMQI
jgi:hypothetical protein